MDPIIAKFFEDAPQPEVANNYHKGFLDGFRAGEEAMTKKYLQHLKRIVRLNVEKGAKKDG